MSDYPWLGVDPEEKDRILWKEFEERFIYKLSEEDREQVYDEADKEWWYDALLTGLLMAEGAEVQIAEDFVQKLEKAYVGELMPSTLMALREKGLVVP